MKLIALHSLSALVAMANAVHGHGETSETATALRGPTTIPPNGCYTNMTDVYSAIADDSKLDEPKRFVICPNTVMDLGYLVPGVGIDKGQSPIIPRSNTEYVCGEDGLSTNNCVLQGGDFGVVAVPVFFREDRELINVQIRGFTFRGQEQYQVFAAGQEGDITFDDCVFEDATPFAPLVFNYESNVLGGTPGSILSVLIKDSTFQNLKQKDPLLGVEPSIISIKTADHDVTVENCLFLNNDYSDKPTTHDVGGYAIQAENATVLLKDNCFIGNQFHGHGTVLLNNTASELEGNFVTEEGNENLKCAFAFFADGTEECSDCHCVAPQVNKCGIEWYVGNVMTKEGADANEERNLENE